MQSILENIRLPFHTIEAQETIMPGMQEHSEQREIYAAGQPDDCTTRSAGAASLCVVLERNPCALARVFSLLATLCLEPQTTSTECLGADAIRVQLNFAPVLAGRLDLLIRKVTQLTDCLEASQTPDPLGAPRISP